MSRHELARAISQHLHCTVDAKFIRRLEIGEVRWPHKDRRDALRAVLGATSDTDLGLYINRPERQTDAALVQDNDQVRAQLEQTVVASASNEGLVESAATLRRRMDQTLAGATLSEATMAGRKAVADQYTRVYKTQPVRVFLPNVLADFDEVQVLVDQRLRSSQRKDLSAVTARLAGLVSMSMVNLGEYREAREWVHTARLAADDTGEPELRAWVATRAAVAHLHFGDLHAALAAAHQAEILTRHQPGGTTAMAWAILARAAALAGDAHAALRGLGRAEELRASVDASPGGSAYAFTAGQLYFYASHALTNIGDTAAARAAQDAALAAFPPHERLDPTLVRLDRALCMIREGDIAYGADYATTILLELPREYRPAIVLRRAAAIASAIPTEKRRLPAVRTFHDLLPRDHPAISAE